MENTKVVHVVKRAERKSRPICILGMHRSGTSAVARAINLLGVYLGEKSQMMPPNPDNPRGYWEHLEIHNLQARLMSRMEQEWDIAEPLPAGWHQTEAIHGFREELAKLVVDNFNGQELWAWKEPLSCLLLPLWREVLANAEMELSCVFVVRNPVEVANSLVRRDGIPFDRALGIWFHYNIVALKAAAGLPIVFLSYDRLMADWESEMGRCTAALDLDVLETNEYREAMNSFLNESLRNHRASMDQLEKVPYPVRELYQIIREASSQPFIYKHEHEETINRLSGDFHAYASLFSGRDQPRMGKNLAKKTVLAWRVGNNSSCRHLQFQVGNGPSPKFLHRLLGKKLCRSICKRLMGICCWLYP